MIQFLNNNDYQFAEISEDHPTIKTVEDIMDFLGDCYYNQIVGVIIPKNVFGEEFYELKTGLSGEITQKFTNYSVKLVIIGDFQQIESKSLRDFIRESNRFKQINFLESREKALKVFEG